MDPNDSFQEFCRHLKKFTKERLQRGQSVDDIRIIMNNICAIMNPDGDVLPFPPRSINTAPIDVSTDSAEGYPAVSTFEGAPNLNNVRYPISMTSITQPDMPFGLIQNDFTGDANFGNIFVEQSQGVQDSDTSRSPIHYDYTVPGTQTGFSMASPVHGDELVQQDMAQGWTQQVDMDHFDQFFVFDFQPFNPGG
jgi:hypothetical protein